MNWICVMTNVRPYEDVAMRIRDDLAVAHQDVLDHLATPGTWWTGTERLAIAAETRHAAHCDHCRRRRKSLSPAAVSGSHDTLGVLPDAIADMVHCVATDPARLTLSFYQRMRAAGVTEEEYVETLSVIVHTIAIDTFAKAMGIEPLALPPARDGEPERVRPQGVVQGAAWVPWIESPDKLPSAYAALYPPGRPAANIMKAMSLVPPEVDSFFRLGAAQYLGPHQMRDFSQEFRAITHAQIELVAARVSSLNQCLY